MTNKIEIFDTKKENNLIVHFAKELPADVSAEFIAVVDDVMFCERKEM